MKTVASRSSRITHFAYIAVLFSFILPIAFLIFRIAAWDEAAEAASARTRADYVLMIIQCLLGIVVIHIPTFFSRRFHFELPTPLYIMYTLFLYCAIFLGEVRSFYYRIPHWDVYLHGFSSLMAGAFGFMVVALLNRDEHFSVQLSPFFVALFAFCFAMTIGAVWEIYEYTFDGLLGLNMQKFITADGVVLSGHSALRDTMKDFIVDAAGALIAAVAGYVSLKNNRGWASEIIAHYSEKHRK